METKEQTKTEFYTVKVKCTNCGTNKTMDIPKGEKAFDVISKPWTPWRIKEETLESKDMCENCGCNTLTKIIH